MKKGEAQFMPPPRREDSFRTTSIRMDRRVDGRSLKPKTTKAQFNCYVSPGFPDRFEALKVEVQAKLKRTMPNGEFVEMIFNAFAEEWVKGSMAIVDSLAAPEIAADDLAAGRSEAVTFFAKPVLAGDLRSTSLSRGWTLGAVLEDAASKAADWEEARAAVEALQRENAQLRAKVK